MLPNRLLERFFKEQGYLVFSWNWNELKERDVEKLQNAINVQPREARLRIESDQRDLFDLAYDSGILRRILRRASFVSELATRSLLFTHLY